jgi:NAD-dependent deacetylase
MTSKIKKIIAKEILKAKNILFITGAGISADSGIPTYRGIGGLYNNKNTKEGIAIETALSGNMILKRPDITWKYLWQIGKACYNAQPNDAHKTITQIQKLKLGTWVLTQNIDNLHNLAGNKNLIELHGNAFKLICTKCQIKTNATKLLNNYKKTIDLPPKCKKCGGIIRPQVILFGEILPQEAIKRYYHILNSHLDLIISIGTSSQFPYIQEPVIFAAKSGITTIEINPEETSISPIVNYKISEGASKAMRNIWNELIKLTTIS